MSPLSVIFIYILPVFLQFLLYYADQNNSTWYMYQLRCFNDINDVIIAIYTIYFHLGQSIYAGFGGHYSALFITPIRGQLHKRFFVLLRFPQMSSSSQMTYGKLRSTVNIQPLKPVKIMVYLVHFISLFSSILVRAGGPQTALQRNNLKYTTK